MNEIGGWLSAAFGAAGVALLSLVRTWKGRRAIARLITGSADLDEQTSKAVSVSIAALQASLDRALKEHQSLIDEVQELRLEVSTLRARDMERSYLIESLQDEVLELRAENNRLHSIVDRIG